MTNKSYSYPLVIALLTVSTLGSAIAQQRKATTIPVTVRKSTPVAPKPKPQPKPVYKPKPKPKPKPVYKPKPNYKKKSTIIIKPGRRVHKVPHGSISFSRNGYRFYFHTGIFYRWDAGTYVVVSAPLGAVVPVLPSGCSSLRINGLIYYELRGSYFKPVIGGYLVVNEPTPAPTVVVAPITTPTPTPAKEVTVWVTNDNGSSTPVLLNPSSDGHWIGPKGEYYSTFPTEAQLKPVYGVPGKIAAEAVPQEPLVSKIWIKNLNGSSTPVELEKQEDGTWKGPLGEIYPTLPSSEDLEAAYGL